MEGFICSGFTFYNAFDSANLAKVDLVPPTESVITVGNGKTIPELPDAEFNLWTKPDCGGTEFENGNRTWFYFGIKAPAPGLTVRLNLVDLNRQGKMYSQGMAPVFRIIPGKPQWERIRDKPIHNTVEDIFTLSFKYKTPENVQSITYFAFTYPFSYADLQKMLSNIDLKFKNCVRTSEDDVYYKKEVLCHSLGGKEVYLLTVTSCHGMTKEVETRLKDLFPDKNNERPFKFLGKKVIYVSARVHPGETPSTFVFNGLLNLLLTKEDPIALTLRRNYVFKMIPFLNPDGVSLGHYRTDMRGVNLNRVYLSPSLTLHPTIYAARALIRYYHFGCEKEDVGDVCADCLTNNPEKNEDAPMSHNSISTQVSHMTLEESASLDSLWCIKCSICRRCRSADILLNDTSENMKIGGDVSSNDSGLFLYVDLHGHASKKGIFMYGNHFEELERSVECMLLPKLMSINNHNFHFTACNFTERNMYLRDKRDGMSREGSGRVAVLKLTGLTKSYTLECNYNTGRLVNVLPPSVKEAYGKMHTLPLPPKYTPQIFEEVGKSLGASILDLTGQNPFTRIPNSEFHSLTGLRDWLRTNCSNESDGTIPLKFRNLPGLHNQGKTAYKVKSRPATIKSAPKRHNKTRPATVPLDRKENLVAPSAQPGCSYSDGEQRIKSGIRLTKSLGIKKKFKNNNGSGDKPKTVKSKFKNLAAKSRLGAKTAERKKLRELCLVKSEEAPNDESMAWKPSCSSEIFIKGKVESVASFISNKINAEAGTSKQSTFRVPNFGKNSSFKSKFKKHPLRRLTNTPEAGKIDKVKIKRKFKK